ncbi:M23 family metallopeptidase, partial [Streptomyces sp. B1866]|uniref:M23 family metallopeptidase n=1 Tax=Streptomyces sp. B1866 TaxID=3075431 RepID=UPI0028905493
RTGAVARAPAGARAWPVRGTVGAGRPLVLRTWEPPPAPWAPGHRGVDLSARAGTPVRAAAAGRVSFAGPVAGRGVLSVELGDSGAPALRTTYEPVLATVTAGEQVTAGQVVGVVQSGPYHCAEGCLHWGLLRGRSYLDPLSLLPPPMLRGGPSRLLPRPRAPGP